MPAAADATAERIRDVNTRYHDLAADSYDSKWGIDFAETGRAQVRAKLSKALGEQPRGWEHALEIGAGTGYFSLNLMTARPDRQPDRDRHRPRNAAGARGQRSGPRARRRNGRCTDAELLPFADETLRPRPRSRRPAPHPRPRPGGGGVPPGPQARRHGRLLRRALRLRRPDRRAAEASGDRRGPGLAPGRRSGQARGTATAPIPTTDTPSSPRSTSMPSSRGTIRRIFGGAGFEHVRIRGEELLANLYGWWLRHGRVDGRARPRSPTAGGSSPSAATSACRRSTTPCWSRNLPPELFYNLVFSARKPGLSPHSASSRRTR